MCVASTAEEKLVTWDNVDGKNKLTEIKAQFIFMSKFFLLFAGVSYSFVRMADEVLCVYMESERRQKILRLSVINFYLDNCGIFHVLNFYWEVLVSMYNDKRASDDLLIKSHSSLKVYTKKSHLIFNNCMLKMLS